MATSRSLPNVVTLADPRPGTVVGVAPGSRLRLRLRSGIGASRWHLADRPGNLLPLFSGDSELSFLVFDGAPATLRLERRNARSQAVREVRELRIEVCDADELAAAGRRSA
ncbi:MAG TPA: hypothetical protein DEQ43_10220 [Nocardioides bacterium]|uniref:hypothetical protein n=1 Tax=uncultured Nocardioides sp. TaxID=198441 RepID=UPI000ECC12BD|nr:hypothetical protein [uncultured Nocardioides sp.]HCB04604.1 hypothetical protein [Nocardioides sp.]